MKEMCEQFGNPQIMNSSCCMNCAFFKPDYFNLCNLYYKNKNMETKEVKIEIPKGYEIDKENSTFEKIVFKPIVKRWRGDESKIISGYYINLSSEIGITKAYQLKNRECNRNIFATKRQAKSALAMAQISQIMANDKRFGGVVTDEEWKNEGITKYCIRRVFSQMTCYNLTQSYHFLAFHTVEQRSLFLEENEDLVKDYLMID